MRQFKVIQGAALSVLPSIPTDTIDCCVTSPPYYGLRDYGADGQFGHERTVKEFVSKLVDVFREVRRVLKPDGTLWVNMGDSYNAAGRTGHGTRDGYKQKTSLASRSDADRVRPTDDTLKPKDLLMVPARLAIALQDDGWYLRADIIWHKPNPMPEPVIDRPTKSHEYLYLLSKSERYYYDAEAIRETVSDPRAAGNKSHKYVTEYESSESEEHRTKAGLMAASGTVYERRNKRSVWTVASEPFHEGHFATFPTALIEPCIMAGSRIDGTVLDPFTGSGTTGLVACRHARNFVGIEIKPEYAEMARRRILDDAPMFNVEV